MPVRFSPLLIILCVKLFIPLKKVSHRQSCYRTCTLHTHTHIYLNMYIALHQRLSHTRFFLFLFFFRCHILRNIFVLMTECVMNWRRQGLGIKKYKFFYFYFYFCSVQQTHFFNCIHKCSSNLFTETNIFKMSNIKFFLYPPHLNFFCFVLDFTNVRAIVSKQIVVCLHTFLGGRKM